MAQPARRSFFGCIGDTSERMGAVGADRELELKKQLVGRLSVGVLPAPQLPPELGELAGPEGEQEGLAAVPLRRVIGVPGRLDPRPGEPALRELVLAGKEPALGRLVAEPILAPALDELVPKRRLPGAAREARWRGPCRASPPRRREG